MDSRDEEDERKVKWEKGKMKRRTEFNKIKTMRKKEKKTDGRRHKETWALIGEGGGGGVEARGKRPPQIFKGGGGTYYQMSPHDLGVV